MNYELTSITISGTVITKEDHCICCIPLSDVMLAKHIQEAINRYIAEDELSVELILGKGKT